MTSRRSLLPVLVFALITLSRIPFLNAGYGVNIDAWRIARVARDIAQTGEYEVSRFPGYPVQEIVCSWFWRLGPTALNTLSALFSIIASIAIWRIGRRLACRDSLLLAAAFAFTPIVFINSVTSKDYVWAIAFVLLALWAALANRPVVSGLLRGSRQAAESPRVRCSFRSRLFSHIKKSAHFGGAQLCGLRQRRCWLLQYVFFPPGRATVPPSLRFTKTTNRRIWPRSRPVPLWNYGAHSD